MRDIVGDFAVLRHLPMIRCCVVDATIDVAVGTAREVMRRRARAEAAGARPAQVIACQNRRVSRILGRH